MSLVIGTNIAAMNTNRNLTSSTNSMNKSLEKLSSGYKINTGKDDPSGLVISEQLRAQISGLERASQNTSEANNVISIAEGALNEMNSILKTMKSLALHSANNGVTSPEQVEADQAEIDSAIKTLQRIADTTKYSDQLLLNGSKDLTYTSNTAIKGTQNNALLDTGSTEFSQIYKRDGYSVTVGYTGATNAGTNAIGTADLSKQAAKAYLEIDTSADAIGQVDDDGNLTQSQSFILTGSLGSRSFTFSSGTHVSDIVTQISNYAGSTGIDASLVFNSDQAVNLVDKSANAATLDTTKVGVMTGVDTTEAVMYDNYKTLATGADSLIAEAIDVSKLDGEQVGLNTDGQGNIYVKVTGVDSSNNVLYELYKDSSMSQESLVGSGVAGGDSVEQNNSGLTGVNLTFSANAAYGDTFYINMGNVVLDGSTSYTGILTDNTGAADTDNPTFDTNLSTVAGVELGTNTSANGSVFIKVVTDDNGNSTVYAYKHEDMKEEDLVAKSRDDLVLAADESVILDQVWNDEHTASTGLSLTLTIGKKGFDEAGTYTGTMTFDNVGARIYTTDYGSDEYIQIQQSEGAIFTYYDQANKASSATLVDAGGTGTTYRQYGQDATINVNGKQMKTDGLVLNVSTTDIKAKMVFNEGKVGSTTIAQVGYGAGSIFTGIGSLTTTSTTADGNGGSALLTQACHNTTETVSKFLGGMQLQLGEGSGDQNRTVIAIKSMAVENLGQVSVTRAFGSNGVIETKTLSISDIQGGQLANLADEPELAMEIIEQAINDVSNLRAELGAVQANLLETNSNNLAVAIENITLTESGIRDTDMASEMTEYTKQQVLNNAGISMLSQANSQAQNILSLLR